MASVGLLSCLLTVAAAAADPPVRADRPYPIVFPVQQARFVRLLIHAGSSGEPCIDELEVYGPDGKRNLALAEQGAKPAASSCLAGYAIHAIKHLNDGRYGNDFSWIAASPADEWAQIELPRAADVAKVVFSRDRKRRYADRVPIHFEVRLSLDGRQWTTAKEVRTTAAAVTVLPRPGHFAASLPPPPPPPPPQTPVVRSEAEPIARLQYAILGEEHAWLKTFGRADLSPRLVPYNGRVKQYPRHVGDDRLPLPPLGSLPKLDGRLDDPCWAEASRGVVRVADPYDFQAGPLVEHAVAAAVRGDDLLLAISTDRLLSSHLAVISRTDGAGVGVLSYTADGPVFKIFDGGNPKESIPLDGKFNDSLTCCEVRLPLELFPDCRSQGIRVGMGLGGKHTPAAGRAVQLRFAPLMLAEVPPCRGGKFRVRMAAAPGNRPVKVHGNAPGLTAGLTLAPGQSKLLSIPAEGPIGPQHELTVETDSGESFVLNLFRYDPLRRTLTLTGEMIERFAEKGIDVADQRRRLAELRKVHTSLTSAEVPDRPAERRALLEARALKRRLFFRDPDLAPIERVLFVKRHAFEPSHNYSVLLDSRWRPGGGVCLAQIPRRDGRLWPDETRVKELFSAGDGIARNPMADFELGKVYFGYRPAADGYYHLMSMDGDGGGLRQLSDGPFHDYWPCPLPDGGLAFVSTRVKARYLCWRPQAAVMFRMDADGQNIRPLSYANLSEWAPSVMSDGRIIWTRSEYVDKGADFSHTLWSIRPDGTRPELVFGNTIIQPNGYANGRQVPGTNEVCCTLISHFGDLNGPIALVDVDRGRFNPQAISSITPEVPWPGMWPIEECFRDPVPIARDYFLCSHAPRRTFALYVIDRFGNREMLHLDGTYGSMCPTPYRRVEPPPVLPELMPEGDNGDGGNEGDVPQGRFVIADVYRGIEPAVKRGTVKYIRVAQELRAELIRQPDGSYQKDHTPFQDWYATPVHKVSGPYGWPSYVAKATWGLAPVESDGSANFWAPAGKVLFFQALDADFNELQRMRSVVQLQPGESRSCIGCHEDRRGAPPVSQAIALRRDPSPLEPPPWGTGPFSYQQVVQPVWDAKCIECHNADDPQKIDLTGRLDADRVPASYRTLISQGWVHYLDWGYNSGGNQKAQPLSFGTVKSKLWAVLQQGHYEVELTGDQRRRIKCWTDLNCPLWPDYRFRPDRPKVRQTPVLAGFSRPGP